MTEAKKSSGVVLLIKNVRIQYADNLFVPRKPSDEPGAKAKFSPVFLFPPNHPDVPALKAAQRQAAINRWGDKAETMLQAFLAQPDRLAIRDGNGKLTQDGSPLEGFQGNLYLPASSKVKPSTFDNVWDDAVGDWKEVTFESGRIYSGCYVNASVEIYAYDNPRKPQHGKRMCVSLRGVQYHSDGEPFAGGGGRRAVGSEFGPAPGNVDAAAPRANAPGSDLI